MQWKCNVTSITLCLAKFSNALQEMNEVARGSEVLQRLLHDMKKKDKIPLGKKKALKEN